MYSPQGCTGREGDASRRQRAKSSVLSSMPPISKLPALFLRLAQPWQVAETILGWCPFFVCLFVCLFVCVFRNVPFAGLCGQTRRACNQGLITAFRQPAKSTLTSPGQNNRGDADRRPHEVNFLPQNAHNVSRQFVSK